MDVDLRLVMAAVLSGGIGVSLGLLGGGGSILAMPVLVYVAGVAPKAAVGMSLAIVGATALLAGFLHRRSGHVDLRVAASFGVAGMTGAYLGAKLTHLLSERALMFSFAGLMLTVGSWMLAGVGDQVTSRAPSPEAHVRPHWAMTVLAGTSVGALTGFLGVGGGFLIVPALVLLARLPIKQAVGTSLFVIALNSAAGFVSHLDDGEFALAPALLFTAVAILGAQVGQRLAQKLSPSRLRRGFAGFVMVVGVGVAVQTWLGRG